MPSPSNTSTPDPKSAGQSVGQEDDQSSSTDLGVRRIMTEAANRSPAPITVRMKCHQLQLNCLWTATAAEVAQPWNFGHVVVDGIVAMTVLVNRVMVHSTHMAHKPTTTTTRNG